jgi:hypothetical protein
MSSTDFDMSKFNDFIDSANKVLSCDSTCQQNQQAESLYQTYLNAKTNMSTAPEQLELATQKYITFTQGQAGYEKYLETQLGSKSSEFGDTYVKKFHEELEKVKMLILVHDNLFLNYSN